MNNPVLRSLCNRLRNGISLVINTANAPKQKVGNEKKLQVAWQNFPTRPQGIYILGTSTFTRLAINALIAFAALFAKNKVIARVNFAEVTDLEKRWGGKSSLPEMQHPSGSTSDSPTFPGVDTAPTHTRSNEHGGGEFDHNYTHGQIHWMGGRVAWWHLHERLL
eukprot:7256079-Prymnesium_polylepis.1